MERIYKMWLSFYVLTMLIPWSVKATIEIFDPLGRKTDSFRDREAYDDDEFPIMDGFIVLADPPDACTAIAEPTFLTNFTFGKFVLINGTEMCAFNRKIKNAENAGYDFAVIFDPTPAQMEFWRLGYINIPAVMISFEDAIVIMNNYLYNNSYLYNYRLRIKPNIPDFSYYMYLFGAVIGVCFFVMLVFLICLLVKCIQERRRSRRNRLSSRQIRQIPTAKYAKGDQYDVCAICLENYNEGDKLRILPCSHAYHAKCIDPWLMNNRRNCPLCKRKITFGDSEDESDSENSELVSPAENTPLLNSQLPNHSQSWGTFVNQARATPNTDTGGPSSLPDFFTPAVQQAIHESRLRIAADILARQRNQDLNANDSDTGGPELIVPPTIRQAIRESRRHIATGIIRQQNQDLLDAVDSDTGSLLPPPHMSINNGTSSRDSNHDVTVQVNFTNPDEGETSGSYSAMV